MLHLGDQGHPGLPGIRGSVGPDGSPYRLGSSGDPGFTGPRGLQGKKKKRILVTQVTTVLW